MSAYKPRAKPEIERLAYTPTELAIALGCTRQHIHNMLSRGELRSVKFGAKRLIPVAVVHEMLTNFTLPGPDESEDSDL